MEDLQSSNIDSATVFLKTLQKSFLIGEDDDVFNIRQTKENRLKRTCGDTDAIDWRATKTSRHSHERYPQAARTPKIDNQANRDPRLISVRGSAAIVETNYWRQIIDPTEAGKLGVSRGYVIHAPQEPQRAESMHVIIDIAKDEQHFSWKQMSRADIKQQLQKMLPRLNTNILPPPARTVQEQPISFTNHWTYKCVVLSTRRWYCIDCRVVEGCECDEPGPGHLYHTSFPVQPLYTTVTMWICHGEGCETEGSHAHQWYGNHPASVAFLYDLSELPHHAREPRHMYKAALAS